MAGWHAAAPRRARPHTSVTAATTCSRLTFMTCLPVGLLHYSCLGGSSDARTDQLAAADDGMTDRRTTRPPVLRGPLASTCTRRCTGRLPQLPHHCGSITSCDTCVLCSCRCEFSQVLRWFSLTENLQLPRARGKLFTDGSATLERRTASWMRPSVPDSSPRRAIPFPRVVQVTIRPSLASAEKDDSIAPLVISELSHGSWSRAGG